MEFPQPDYLDENNEWRWLFYAQHHGLHTQLLDWTSNPLVALYFAVENIISKPGYKRWGKSLPLFQQRYEPEFRCSNTGELIRDRLKEPFGAVWCLKVDRTNFVIPESSGTKPKEIDNWIMINPEPVTGRLGRQSGKFSFHPRNNCEDLDTLNRKKNEELVKIIIRENYRSNPSKEIRNKLGIMNVHHAALFPDADGVAQFINNEWEDIAISHW